MIMENELCQCASKELIKDNYILSSINNLKFEKVEENTYKCDISGLSYGTRASLSYGAQDILLTKNMSMKK